MLVVMADEGRSAGLLLAMLALTLEAVVIDVDDEVDEVRVRVEG